MKIIARENRPYSDRIVASDVNDIEGRIMIAALNSTEAAIRTGRKYRIVEDDAPVIERLTKLTGA
jgi:hypothetical protein